MCHYWWSWLAPSEFSTTLAIVHITPDQALNECREIIWSNRKIIYAHKNLKPRTSPSILFVWREKMPFKPKFIGNLVLLDNVITEPSIYPQEPWLLVWLLPLVSLHHPNQTDKKLNCEIYFHQINLWENNKYDKIDSKVLPIFLSQSSYSEGTSSSCKSKVEG